ncbi:MAG: hypothetical protein IPL71_20185 [Anaerolineales bacterium]|uniref:hypothetical protein n=1 Tax=Candidatus Villigracilis proximus TaxID=3140683 RepID=UPI003134FF39|nr:hypothetical protein [Anaerolineales bacterium]
MQTTIDQGALPENYQEVLSWKLTGKPMRVIALNVVGVIFFFHLWDDFFQHSF